MQLDNAADTRAIGTTESQTAVLPSVGDLRRRDGSYDPAAIARFDDALSTLLDAAGADPHTLGDKLHAYRNYHTMRGQTAALTMTSKALEDLLEGDRLGAADNLRLAVKANDLIGGTAHNRELVHLVEQMRSHLLDTNPCQPEASTATRDCPSYDGKGVVLAPAWRDWHARVDDARKRWGANHRSDDSWYDTDEARAFARGAGRARRCRLR
jgi:hypothetical protein